MLPVRIHSGRAALSRLPSELERVGSTRAMIVCGKSVSTRTPLIDDLRTLMGARCATVFDAAERHAPVESVLTAVAQAQEAQIDAIVAVGGGSLMMFGRMVAILLAETGAPEALMTQYAQDQPAVSPRLDQPKVPIFNVTTVPTNAQFHAGSAMKNLALNQRMEYFDPKTRPAAIFWDADALMTAPVALARAGGLATFFWSLAGMGEADRVSPLERADIEQAFRLALDALPRLYNEADSDGRLQMCAAAFLQYRGAGNSARTARVNWPVRATYALSAGLFNADDGIEPGLAYLALLPAAVRVFGSRSAGDVARMCHALSGVALDPDAPGLGDSAASLIRAAMQTLGVSIRLRDLVASRDALAPLRAFAQRNYNADPDRDFLAEGAALDAVLEDGW